MNFFLPRSCTFLSTSASLLQPHQGAAALLLPDSTVSLSPSECFNYQRAASTWSNLIKQKSNVGHDFPSKLKWCLQENMRLSYKPAENHKQTKMPWSNRTALFCPGCQAYGRTVVLLRGPV